MKYKAKYRFLDYKCPKCNNRDNKHINNESIYNGGILYTTEYDIVCNKCNTHIAHWNYGEVEYYEANNI